MEVFMFKRIISLFRVIVILVTPVALLHGMEPGQKHNNALARINVIMDHVIERPQKVGLGDRPAPIKVAVDSAFEKNKDTQKEDWLYNGHTYYALLDLDEDVLFKYLACENPEERDVYIIDVGCAQGRWGKNAQYILADENIKKSGKRFHIFSVTGGVECDELVERKDHVTLYQFNQFKIENIDEEFAKRGFDLKNKVNLIVSNWTLRHLIDPFGTLKRMYSLLNPKQGKLISNGFLFKYNDNDEIQAFPMDNENILSNSIAICLFRYFTVGRDTGQFLLMRTDHNELNIPLEYTGQTHELVGRWQCASGKVTVFNKSTHIKQNFEPSIMNKDQYIYCAQDDQHAKNLYNALLKQNLFYKHPIYR